MKEPRILSLPVLPESVFGRLQITAFPDGCIEVIILEDEMVDCLVHLGKKAVQAKSTRVGLTKQDSNRLRQFLKSEGK